MIITSCGGRIYPTLPVCTYKHELCLHSKESPVTPLAVSAYSFWCAVRFLIRLFKHFKSRTKIAEFANSVNPDEAAHHKLLHQDLHCLPFTLWIFNIQFLGRRHFFFNFADKNLGLLFAILKINSPFFVCQYWCRYWFSDLPTML